MKQGTWLVVLWSAMAAVGWGQAFSGQSTSATGGEKPAEASAAYTIQGATPEQERRLRTQIQIMQPDVLPQRVVFLPHGKYLYAARMFHLHVPTGMASRMFSHLASRSVFIDEDHYGDDQSLGYWMAHELGHLTANSADENEAEKAAAAYRRRLKDARQASLH